VAMPRRAKPRSDSCHEWMIHSRAGTMGQYVATLCVGRIQHQAGNANRIAHCDADGFGNRRRNDAILAKMWPHPLFRPTPAPSLSDGRFWHKADMATVFAMSAFGGKADITNSPCDVRY
jgi:hypothetical protein